MAKMINFETGLQEIDVNGAATIRINPMDEGFLEELYGLLSKLEEIATETEPGEHVNLADRFDMARKRDRLMREAVDDICGTDFCQKVFGDSRLFALSGGLTLIENFLYGVLDYMDDDLKAQQAKRNEKIAFYTAKYRKAKR